jgi:GNAT superfamily N-acetyltransferase
MVGYSGLRLPDVENAHVGIARITVHPDFLGHGFGTELLREMLPALRTAGLTELWVRQHNDVALQRDTAVLAQHRGHGIGLVLNSQVTALEERLSAI